MAHESPLRPEERERYGTAVGSETEDPLEPDPPDRPGAIAEPAGAPIWMVVAVVLLVAFVILLGAWAFFLR